MLDYEHLFKKFKNNEIIEHDPIIAESHLGYSFIKYYKIKDDKITIYFSLITLTVPYSKELELKLLEQMKKQINEYSEKINKNNSNEIITFIYLINAFIQYLQCLTTESKLFHAITGTIWLTSASIWAYPLLKDIIINKDIKKHNLFLENEEEINKTIKQKMLEQGIVDEEAINLVPLFDSYVTLNDIHSMNKKEIQNLINGKIDKEIIYKLRKDTPKL